MFRQSGKASSRSLLKAIWHASNYPKIRGTMGEEELYSGSRGRLDGKNGVWLSEWSEPWVMLLKVVTLLMRVSTCSGIRRLPGNILGESHHPWSQSIKEQYVFCLVIITYILLECMFYEYLTTTCFCCFTGYCYEGNCKYC